MTLGTGIFLSAVFIGIVALLICTKEKWTWKALLLYPVAAILGVGLAVAAFFYLEDLKSEKMKKSVGVSVRYNSSGPHPDYPIHIFIANYGTKTVTRVEGRLLARTPGHSTELIGYDLNPNSFESDKILAPGESCSLYYRLPKPETYSRKTPLETPEKLEWGASVSQVVYEN